MGPATPYRPDRSRPPPARSTRAPASHPSPAEDDPTPSRSRWPAVCASRGRSSRSPSRWSSSALFVGTQRRPARRGPGADRSTRTRSCSWRRSSSSTAGFPLRGLRWAILLRGTGLRIARRRTRPRSSSCRGSSTASCRPSSATSTGPTCSRSTAPRRCRARSGPSSSSASSTSSRSPSSAWRPGSGASATACRRRSRSSFGIGVVRRRASSPSGLLTMRNVGRRILVALPLPAPGPRALRPIRGGRLRRRRPAGSCPRLVILTGLHLDDRGAAPVPRRPGPRLPGRLSWDCRARSSSRSSGRC